MFELTIGNEVYEFNFGVGFVRDINKLVKKPIQGASGAEEEIGLAFYMGKIYDGDVVALVDVLQLANRNKKPRATVQILEEYIEDEGTDIDGLFEEVLGFFKTSNATKVQALRLAKAIEEAQEEQ